LSELVEVVHRDGFRRRHSSDTAQQVYECLHFGLLRRRILGVIEVHADDQQQYKRCLQPDKGCVVETDRPVDFGLRPSVTGNPKCAGIDDVQ